MPFYAHALIEHDGHRYDLGDDLPDDLPGLASLVEQGAAGAHPPVVQITAGDHGSAGDGGTGIDSSSL